jgi:hypothetical protein
MPVSSLADETALFIGAYTKFRHAYKKEQGPSNLAPYGHVEFPKSIPMHLAMFHGMADEFLRELANELNRLDSNVEKLETWSDVYEGYDQEERMCLMMEFIEPLATVAFGQPSTLRAKYIFSLSHTSHQANLHSVAGWSESKLPADFAIGLKNMRKCSEDWEKYCAFAAVFDQLDNEEWRALTKGFRNKYQHRIPPRFEVGYTQYVTRNIGTNGDVSYGFGSCEPLSIKTYLPALRQQHVRARKCFDLYSELLREQWEAINVS